VVSAQLLGLSMLRNSFQPPRFVVTTLLFVPNSRIVKGDIIRGAEVAMGQQWPLVVRRALKVFKMACPRMGGLPLRKAKELLFPQTGEMGGNSCSTTGQGREN
jgi:hypothetical protein